MNVTQLIQMFRNGSSNPQQVVINMLQEQMGSTPMGQNLIQLAKEGNGAGIEQIARNICQQQGLDFDKEFDSFRKTLGL